MADRFPSLDDFDAGQTETKGAPAADSSEEPSDFLARERAALGEDAEQFSTPADNAATVEEDTGDDDLLGGGGGGDSMPTNGDNDMMMGGGNDMGDFESSFPAVDTGNEGVAPGGTITGSTLPYRAPSTAPQDDEGEPEVLREWRERRDMQIQHRDEVSANRKAETVKAAQESIDEFYENYNNRKDKTIAQTRKEAEEFLQKREDTTAGGTSWERIAKLVDLSGKGASGGSAASGKGKMRELLVSLRKDEKAPGATGY
ncbi:hypothetical protein MBLNU230_g3137t1 [Neophaeotheca triangularis]